MEKKYFGVVETAKLIRQSLKAAFPGVKFSVKSESYSGGSSVNVHWVDGPSQKAVEEVVGAYQSGRFDGMIDMAYSVSSWLWFKDGVPQVAWGKSPGSSGSGGMDSGYDHQAPDPSAILVHFGAKHLFCKRSISPEFKALAVKAWEAMPWEEQSKKRYEPGFPWWDHMPEGERYAYFASASDLA